MGGIRERRPAALGLLALHSSVIAGLSRFTMVVENFAVYVRAVPTLRTRSETTYDFGLKNLLASFIAFRAEPYSLPTASRISENACTVRGEM